MKNINPPKTINNTPESGKLFSSIFIFSSIISLIFPFISSGHFLNKILVVCSGLFNIRILTGEPYKYILFFSTVNSIFASINPSFTNIFTRLEDRLNTV